MKSLKIFEVRFSKYQGDIKWVLASNFDEAVKKTRRWGQYNKFGADLDKIELVGTVDIQ